MNRELAEVRRYWPRAKRSGRLLADGAVVLTVYAAWRRRIAVYADGTATVDGRVSPTIPEAMRAAGFGVRPLGIMGRDPARVLADRQRPRKGARLGRRKREAQP